MKNVKSCLLVLAAAFVMSACGTKTETSQTSSIDPNVEVLDEGNTQVAFNEITRNVLINDKAKAYIDKMHAEEDEGIACGNDPYTFDALNGVDKVDVKNELSQSDSSKNKPIEISWEKGDMDYESIKLLISENWRFDDYREISTTGASVQVDNLKRATTYYYRLTNEDGSILSQVQKFETADYVRKMNFDGADGLGETIYNVRDEGGYMTSYGVRTNQGFIYRGSEINDAKFTAGGSTHKCNVDDIVMEKQRTIFKIGCELDLRKEDAISPNNLAGICGLSTEDMPVDYVRCSFNNYTAFVADPDNGIADNLKTAFDCLANADEKPCYFHCWGGADRTGALGLVLNGILGVSYTDLMIDFELTTQHNSVRSHLTKNGGYDMPGMLKAFKALEYYEEGMSIKDLCVEFLTRHGVTMETINKIRSFMLPGYDAATDSIIA